MSNTEFFTGFGPEDVDVEQLSVGDAGRILLDSQARSDPEPPVPQQSLHPSITSPAGMPPDYVDPRDRRRVEAFGLEAPAPTPLPDRNRIVIHHVQETIQRGAETGVIWQANVTTTPQRLLGKTDVRIRCTVFNSGTNTVYLGMNEQVVGGGINAFPLAAGASFDIRHRDEQWIVLAASASSNGQVSLYETQSEISPTQLGELRRADGAPQNGKR